MDNNERNAQTPKCFNLEIVFLSREAPGDNLWTKPIEIRAGLTLIEQIALALVWLLDMPVTSIATKDRMRADLVAPSGQTASLRGSLPVDRNTFQIAYPKS